jgi:hypothetical protein
MSRSFHLTPRDVPRIETPLRRIATALPAPESLSILETLRRIEPVAMQGQPPIVWHRAEGFQVFDPAGNKWIDWSSGVVVANAGHGRKEVIDAIQKQAAAQLLTNYCFPSEPRARLLEKLASLLPEPLKKIFLLTTGSETVECAIKLCRTWGLKQGGRHKHVIVSFEHPSTGALSARSRRAVFLRSRNGSLTPIRASSRSRFRMAGATATRALKCSSTISAMRAWNPPTWRA